ncbi:MAG: DUF1289 domain-containing protein [Planctomycetes bacterium]|nr:DUF1289 domain-containing protein [Planctomycetota bacterium]
MKDGLRQIETPCINVCVVDKHGYCSGCRRTLDEIAKWGSMSDAERQRVLSFLPGRVVGRGGAGRRGDSV